MRPPFLDLVLNAVTTHDNKAFDIIRVGMVVSGVAMIALTFIDTYINKNAFDALAFGGGLAAIFGGGGFGIAAKSRDEQLSVDTSET